MTLDNQYVIDSLRHGDHAVLRRIYKETQKEFQQWSFSQYKLPSGESEEIFQNTVIIFYEKIVSGGLDLSSHWKTYLFAIGKNKIREYLRAAGRSSSLEGVLTAEPEDSLEEDELEVDGQRDLVIKCIDKLGSPCKDLIVAYYYKKMALDEISLQLGYKNSNSAKNQKFKCMQRLRDLFLQLYKPML